MKKLIITLIILSQINTITGQILPNGDIVSSGSNSWIFHTPDDGKTSLFIAPVKSGSPSEWDWINGFEFNKYGNLILPGTLNAGYLTIKPQNTSNEGGEIRLEGSGSYSPVYLDNNSGDFRIFNDSGQKLNLYKNGTLQIWGDIKAEGRVFSNQTFVYEANSSNNSSPGITGVLNDNFLYEGKYLNHYGLGFYRGTSNTNFKMYISNYFGMDFFTRGTRQMILTESGHLGIGTSNPDEKLTVNGTVHAQEVKVDLQIPADYVFQKYYTGDSSLKPEYKLPSLNEVEEFTKENHHLPGIPSAREIQENGLKVGQMSNLLLQKIEELTLYSIEQEKLIQKQNTLLGNQQNELDTLKEQLNEIRQLISSAPAAHTP